MLDKLKKYLRFLISGSFALIIAACYGMPVDYDSSSKSFSTKDDSGEPIPDLQLSLQETVINTEGTTTNTNTNTLSTEISHFNGTVIFTQEEWIGDFHVLVEDIDGTTNGSWQSTNIEVDYYDTDTEIIMQSAE
jgi:putative lipoprotein (rSAM/lipoprotein system)